MKTKRLAIGSPTLSAQTAERDGPPRSVLRGRGSPTRLDEMFFRFNNRKNRFLFRDTMLKLIGSPNLEYKQLTAQVRDAA